MKMNSYQHFTSFKMVALEKCFSRVEPEWLVGLFFNYSTYDYYLYPEVTPLFCMVLHLNYFMEVSVSMF